MWHDRFHNFYHLGFKGEEGEAGMVRKYANQL